MKEETQKNPNEMSGMFAKKYLQGKSYGYVVATRKHIKTIAEISCKFPTLTVEN